MPRKTKFPVAAGLLILSLAACSSQKAAEPGSGGTPAGGAGGRGGRGGGGPVPVVTGRVETKAIPVTIPAVGTAEALATVQVRSQVTGQLSAIHFREGQEVRKGQVLFTIDPRPFQAALQQAQAVLARDTATAKNSQSQQARYEDLYKRGLIPRDQYETQAATASAQQSTLAADQAAVETARLNLQYTNIVAPISGRAGALVVHQGDLVRANDAAPLLVINQMAPIYVGFSVPGRNLADIRRYQSQRPLKVQARLQGSPTGPTQMAIPTPEGREGDTPRPEAFSAPVDTTPAEEGSVTFIDNAVDPTTGTIKLKATFPNSGNRLWPGLFVQVTLLLTTDTDALVVPANAVQESQQGTYVYVIKPDRTAEMRNVRVERRQGEETVIAQGLKAGEEVVTDGHLRLTPGARVTTGTDDGARGGRGGAGGSRGEGGGQGGAEGRRGGGTS
ncbi:MAG: efflux RND transporter periplasmic adaptor subunit [Acidobacteriota bacterium]|nr:efflux RND transporter periplasmic adaptor subunit [Acidobacteriota bacterium]